MNHVYLIPVYFLALIWGVYTAAYIAIKGKGILDRNKVRRALFALPDVSDADKVAAWKDMQAAFKADLKTLFYDYSAPFVTAIALIGLPETATKLPNWARKWDNNVSMNGDGRAVLRDGQWLTLRGDAKAEPGERIYSYDDLEYTGPTYAGAWWLDWISDKPRSYVQRWWWGGVRNRASQASVDVGVDVLAHAWPISGDPGIDRGKGITGHSLTTDGRSYQYRSIQKGQLLGFPVAVIRNVGFKLDNANTRDPAALGRVAAVAIGVSYKRWKA